MRCFVVIAACYSAIVVFTYHSSSTIAQRTPTSYLSKRNGRLQRQIKIIIATDVLCWIPFILTSLLHTLEISDMSKWYAAFSVAILPLNSVVNPVLYEPQVIAQVNDIIQHDLCRICTTFRSMMSAVSTYVNKD